MMMTGGANAGSLAVGPGLSTFHIQRHVNKEHQRIGSGENGRNGANHVNLAK